MPKTGFAHQVCACGSGIRPHVVVRMRASSLHVSERVLSTGTTLYFCERCIQEFKSSLGRNLSQQSRERIITSVSDNAVAIWDEIRELVPN
jgi:hypothetical protein